MSTTVQSWQDQATAIATTAPGVTVEHATGWFVCLCTDAQHGLADRVGDVVATQGDAERHRWYVAGAHTVQARRVTLTQLEAVTS